MSIILNLEERDQRFSSESDNIFDMTLTSSDSIGAEIADGAGAG